MSVLKKKYTIWQNLKERGHYRVFNFPEYPGIWGTETKLTFRNNQVTRFHVNIIAENGLSYSFDFETFDLALDCWTRHFAKK